MTIDVSRCCALLLAVLLSSAASFGGEAPRTELTFGTPEPPPRAEAAPPPPAAPPSPASEPAARSEQVKGADLLKEAFTGAARQAAPTLPVPAHPVVPASPAPPPKPPEENQPLFREASPQPKDAGAKPPGNSLGAGPSAESRASSTAGVLARFFGAIVVVGALMAAGYWWLGKYRGLGLAGAGSKGLLEVLARIPVEPGRSILLVKAGQMIIIVGSTSQGLTRLAEISDKQEVETLVRQAGQGRLDAAFPAQLEQAARELEEEKPAD